MTDNSEILKAAYFTLGCKLNFAETSAIGRQLINMGIERAALGEKPDIIVVNTCSVTETSDKKARRLIRSLHTRWPQANIIVTGCYAQLKPQEVASIEGVDIVLGSGEKLHAAEYLSEWLEKRKKSINVGRAMDIKEFVPSCQRGERTRWWLKVQDGCDYFCTYCTIPYARGRSRSGNIAELTSLVRDAASEGAKEVVITGVNIGEFGSDTGEKFFDLLRSLDSVEGIQRFRISSIEPNLLTEEIIRWIASEARAFMPHFHIPLQSGSDRVLKLMNRRYDTALFADRISLIRSLIPDAFIGVDIIAGARGETPEEWERSLAFAESLDVTRYHVFPYSERPGTAALALGDIVSQQEKHRRVSLLTSLSDRKLSAFIKSMEGTIRPVLWEHPVGNDRMSGLTDNYIRVSAPLEPQMLNTVTSVMLAPPAPEEPDTLTVRL
ncbi:MAG: tRNA (N(6)-L-threonylcarbamoyladenosine(37)-C(2))-methylthiotransferase MtaB [Bacteroidales bacterium]|nr:tRNA (N(6)-L-threonylcarbamoyladenosine(37)-C(2))-methylthiotransferase MtaB [Bacteroidales bacterium]